MSLLRLCASTTKHLRAKGLLAEAVFTGSSRTASGAVKDQEPLRKAKTPQGRLDITEEKSKDVLERARLMTPVDFRSLCKANAKCYSQESNQWTHRGEKEFPDDVNPDTKEKGGPRGPEPTRYGDWERKGRCIDF